MLGYKSSKTSTINLLSYRKTYLQQLLELISSYGLFLSLFIFVLIIALSTYNFFLKKELMNLNQDINNRVVELNKQSDLQNNFLLMQKKLSLYQQLSQTEKMEDLFPKLSSLIPEGVQVRNLTIGQDQVELICFVTDQTALTRFVNNLNLANNTVFSDGQKLTISNTNAKEIAKSTDKTAAGGNNGDNSYDFSLSFNYTLD